MIRAVIVLAERQRAKVERLVKYCEELDGTKLEVVEYGKEDTDDRHEASFLSFRKACSLFTSEPFVWMEADAIPLKPGWKWKIIEEHLAKRKLFTLPDLTGLSHFDHASGIGIYPKNAGDYVPTSKPQMPYLNFDHWIYDKHSHQINFTRLIQHSFGIYRERKRQLKRRHEFPRDRALIRPDALIFHSDPNQGLIPA